MGPRPPTMELSQPSGEHPPGVPQTGGRPPSPEASPLPSDDEDSSYEDSDSKRKKRNRERRERHDYNMSRPNNETYVAIRTDQKKKEERKRKRQEEKGSNQRPYHRGGRGGGRGGREIADPTGTRVPQHPSHVGVERGSDAPPPCHDVFCYH